MSGARGHVTHPPTPAPLLQNSIGQHGKVGAGPLDSQVDLVDRNKSSGIVLEADGRNGAEISKGPEAEAKAKRARIPSSGNSTKSGRKTRQPKVAKRSEEHFPSHDASNQSLWPSDLSNGSDAGAAPKAMPSASPTSSGVMRSSSLRVSPRSWADDKSPRNFHDASHLTLQEADVHNKMLLQSRLLGEMTGGGAAPSSTPAGRGSTSDLWASFGGARPLEAAAHAQSFQGHDIGLKSAAMGLSAGANPRDQAGASLQGLGRLPEGILSQQTGVSNNLGSLLETLQAQLQAPASGQGVHAPSQQAPSGLGPQMQLRLLEQLYQAQQVSA